MAHHPVDFVEIKPRKMVHWFWSEFWENYYRNTIYFRLHHQNQGFKNENFDDFGGSNCTQASGTKILQRLHIFQAYEELAHMKPVPNCCFSLIIFYISLIFGASVFWTRFCPRCSSAPGQKEHSHFRIFSLFDFFIPFLVFFLSSAMSDLAKLFN